MAKVDSAVVVEIGLGVCYGEAKQETQDHRYKQHNCLCWIHFRVSSRVEWIVKLVLDASWRLGVPPI